MCYLFLQLYDPTSGGTDDTVVVRKIFAACRWEHSVYTLKSQLVSLTQEREQTMRGLTCISPFTE